MEAQIEDLEKKFQLNHIKDIHNEVVVPTDEEIAVYVGETIGLHFDGMDIRGIARLSRYERTEGTRNKRKLIRWFPPKFQTQKVPFVDDKIVWRIDSENHDFFLSDGELKTEYHCSAHYRADLRGVAVNQGLGLSHKLFEMVFGPIDSKIMEMYRQRTRGFK